MFHVSLSNNVFAVHCVAGHAGGLALQICAACNEDLLQQLPSAANSSGSGDVLQRDVPDEAAPTAVLAAVHTMLNEMASGDDRSAAGMSAIRLLVAGCGRDLWRTAQRSCSSDILNGTRVWLGMQVSVGYNAVWSPLYIIQWYAVSYGLLSLITLFDVVLSAALPTS